MCLRKMKVIVTDIDGVLHIIEDYGYEGKTSSGIKILALWRKSEDNPDYSDNDRYLVLASNEGDLFDPLDTSNNIHKRDRDRGGMFWRLRQCSKECYKQYSTFLRSKSRTPYLIAQRRFRNDF
jgi:hypothetical protein